MSLIDKVDITKFSDEELQAIGAETKLRIHLQAKNSNLRDHLWALVHAVGRLLDDKYSEGDEKVRNQLWSDMHRTGDKAREYLQNSEPKVLGEIEKGPEAIDILKALCALKKHKDTVGKDEYYEKAQPEVWKIANRFIEKHNL